MDEIALILHQGDDEPFWDYLNEDIRPGLDQIISRDETAAKLEDLSQLCDKDAEYKNNHDFCGVHTALAAILDRQYGTAEATKTMLQIAKLGGLHSM